MSTIIAIFGFALFDYFGYNLSVKKGWVNEDFINPYRIVQMIVQVGITAILFFFFGLIPAIGFTLLWWTFVADWIYYLYCFIFNYNDTRQHWLQIFDNVVTWAWWTPAGLYLWAESGNKNAVINWGTLCFQSWIGILATILINLIW